MPEWLQAIAEHQPVTPLIDTIRGLLTGTQIGTDGIWAVGWRLLFIVTATVWGSLLFRRKAGRR